MRFPPLVALSAFAAFAEGYGISRVWSSVNSSGINQIKTAIHNSKTVARAETAESNTERLITLCEKPGSLSRDHEIFETLQADGRDGFPEGGRGLSSAGSSL